MKASLPLIALFAFGGLTVFVYSHATRTHVPKTDPAERPLRVATATEPEAHVNTAPEASTLSSQNSEAPADNTTTRWTTDALGEDPTKRAAAITALGAAPRAQAIPVLQRVLSAGEPLVDRPLALKSLRAIALAQGDADEGIRKVLRQAIYHGDDDATVQGAQAVLDDVENASN